jgi:hypothetical protein
MLFLHLLRQWLLANINMVYHILLIWCIKLMYFHVENVYFIFMLNHSCILQKSSVDYGVKFFFLYVVRFSMLTLLRIFASIFIERLIYSFLFL